MYKLYIMFYLGISICLLMLNYFVRMFMKKVANFQERILKKNAYFSSHELLFQGI